MLTLAQTWGDLGRFFCSKIFLCPPFSDWTLRQAFVLGPHSGVARPENLHKSFGNYIFGLLIQLTVLMLLHEYFKVVQYSSITLFIWLVRELQIWSRGALSVNCLILCHASIIGRREGVLSIICLFPVAPLVGTAKYSRLISSFSVLALEKAISPRSLLIQKSY